MTTLKDIDDIRNGIYANHFIREAFDFRRIAILKVCHIFPPASPFSDSHVAANLQTPNHILNPEDIPPGHDRDVYADVSYPASGRYTLQWLEAPDPSQEILTLVPNNRDATFKNNTEKPCEKPKPSDLLLQYNYGAAAVKRWGHGTEVLKNHTSPPRPSMPIHPPIRPSKSFTAGAGTGESEGQAAWDEDDVVLFFWANTQAARERRLKKVEENTQRMEQWRRGVHQDSV